MKTITCRAMGGMCDEPIIANNMDEMIAKGMEHLKVAHPEMAQSIEQMPKDDPMMLKWYEDFKTTWESTPEAEY